MIILIVLLLLFLYYIEPSLTKQSLKINNEHGSARWSTKNEIQKNFVKEKIGKINEAGFPIYYSKNNKFVYFDRETPHWLYIGSTGSGKTATSVLSECSFYATAKKKKSMFITDPKGEIFEKTSQMFKDNGYNILTLDFRNPSLSNHLNILDSIINEYELYLENNEKSIKEVDRQKSIVYKNNSIFHLAECNQLVDSLSSMIMNDITAHEKFWNNSACDLLYGLIFFFLEEYGERKIKRENITLTSIKKFQNSFMTEKNMRLLKKYIEQKDYSSKSKDKLQSLLNISDTTFRSIISTFNERMRLFDDINVENITSESDFDFNILGKKATVLYCCIPDENKIYYSLISIIVSLIYKSLVILSNEQQNKRLPVELVFMLDEFANTPPLTDIETLVSVARSRGMWFRFFIQSFAQLDNLYGKDISQVIQDNCGLVYLKTNTQETAEAISRRLGNKTIKSNSLNYSFENNNGSHSINLMSRNLLTADEIKQLHHKVIIFPTLGYPIFRNTVIYTKFKCYTSGKISRHIRPLERLINTYYTIDQLNSNSNENNENINTEEKIRFQLIIKEILKSFVNVGYEIEYNTVNNLSCASIYLTAPMSKSDIIVLNDLSKKMNFHFNVIMGKENIKRENRNSKIEIFLIQDKM